MTKAQNQDEGSPLEMIRTRPCGVNWHFFKPMPLADPSLKSVKLVFSASQLAHVSTMCVSRPLVGIQSSPTIEPLSISQGLMLLLQPKPPSVPPQSYALLWKHYFTCPANYLVTVKVLGIGLLIYFPLYREPQDVKGIGTMKVHINDGIL